MKKLSELSFLALEDLSNLDEKGVLEHFVKEYEANLEELKGLRVLVAYESVGDYGCDSSSWFLLRKGKDLFEVHGSHCSCYGFEGQFKPEPTSVNYLKSDKFSFSTGGYCSGGQSYVEQVKKYIAENL